jgi:hypothetical protein
MAVARSWSATLHGAAAQRRRPLLGQLEHPDDALNGQAGRSSGCPPPAARSRASLLPPLGHLTLERLQPGGVVGMALVGVVQRGVDPVEVVVDLLGVVAAQDPGEPGLLVAVLKRDQVVRDLSAAHADVDTTLIGRVDA